ncbi:MAG: hypothetical protein OEV21_01210 [Thermoplasmata archaeon]|nr:hypothetical protein [Thermoplasmata archaeon]
MDEKVEREMHLLATAPLAAKWIEENRKFDEKDIENYSKLYPFQFEWTTKANFEEIIELLSRYRTSPMYSKHIEKVLSPAGLKWLEETLSTLKQAVEKK